MVKNDRTIGRTNDSGWGVVPRILKIILLFLGFL
jgi:hypothetical protein